MGLTKKSLLERENQRQQALFALSDRPSFTIHPTSVLPWSTFGRNLLTMSRRNVPLGQGSLDFIYYNEHPVDQKVSENQKFRKTSVENFVWRTTQENISKVVGYGILNLEAPTARVVGALGGYRLRVLERAYDDGIISNKYEQKNALITFTQKRIQLLQEMERLTNNYNPMLTAKLNLQRVESAIDNYIAQVNKLHFINFGGATLQSYDASILKKVTAQLREDIAAAKAFKFELTEDSIKSTTFAATGSGSIATFTKARMICAIKQAQEHNQNITYSRSAGSFFRGELNSYCEDALRIINEHQADHHNPVLAEHQGVYSSNTCEQRAVDFSHLAKNRTAARHALMAISIVEEFDQIKSDGAQYYLRTMKKKVYDLKTTRFTQWDTNADKIYMLKRVFAWFYNVIVGIVLGLTVDLFVGFVKGLMGEEVTSYAEQYKIYIQNNVSYGSKFAELDKLSSVPSVSLGAKCGGMIGNLFRNVVWESFKGVKHAVKKATLFLWEELKSDYIIGHYGVGDKNQLIAQILKEVSDTHMLKTSMQSELAQEYKEKYGRVLNENFITSDEINIQYAAAPYHLSSGEFSDVVNACLRGAEGFVRTIIHEIHAKHPMTGVALYNFVYFAAGLAVYSPQMVQFLGPKYIAFSNTIGHAFSRSQLSAAISSAATQAPLAATAQEFVINGSNSWFTNFLSALEQDPSDLLIYAALAVSIGAIATYKMNIPFLSEEIRSDLGTVPILSLGFGGAKLAFILVELLEAHARESQSDIDIDLSHHSKRMLLELIQEESSDQRELYLAAAKALFPEKEQSIAVITITTIFGYIPALARCLATVITWNLEPWRVLREKTIKDCTRLVHAIAGLIDTMVTFMGVMICGLFDILANEIFARAEAFIRDDEHALSHGTYVVSQAVAAGSMRFKEKLATPVNALRKTCTSPAAGVTKAKLLSGLRTGFFANKVQQSSANFNLKGDWVAHDEIFRL